ncbi:Protein SRT-31 [Aphelenchoides avenae]|nr:Protein SRT-31 [Aphelenchus avenae]
MERFFFDHEYYAKYYNCSRFTSEEWYQFGKPNLPLGIIYFTLGSIYVSCYIPCLVVMTSPKFLKNSCYKIMLYLGVIDVGAIAGNSLFAGYYAWTGALYCTHPTLMYITGSIEIGMWTCACMTVMILAINRCVDILRPAWMDAVFSGWRTYLWLIPPTVYGGYFTIFTPPHVFTSIYYADFFDPYAGIEPAMSPYHYENYSHTTNNFIVITVLICSYTFLCLYISYRSRMSKSELMSAVQRQIIIQASIICGLVFVAAAIYVYMNFFGAPVWMVVLAHLTWQASHGSAALIYLCLNKSIRRAVLHKFGCSRGQVVDVTAVSSSRVINKSTKTPVVTSLRTSSAHDRF